MQSCLEILRKNDVDVDTAVDRLMGNDNLYLDFIKRLPNQLNLAMIRVYTHAKSHLHSVGKRGRLSHRTREGNERPSPEIWRVKSWLL